MLAGLTIPDGFDVAMMLVRTGRAVSYDDFWRPAHEAARPSLDDVTDDDSLRRWWRNRNPRAQNYSVAMEQRGKTRAYTGGLVKPENLEHWIGTMSKLGFVDDKRDKTNGA